MIRRQFTLDLHQELIVDNFAGGGGASTAIELALGRHVDHAINHDPKALGMHRINHPQTVHHCEDVFDIDPWTVTEGRPVGLAHFSPDCKHFSKAKGGKPLDKRIRGLVLVMLRWAKIRCRVMTMENVEEIVTWGPLKYMERNGVLGWFPDPDHKGRTWKAFLSILSTGIAADHPDLPEILEVLDGTVTLADCVRGFGYRYEYKDDVRACDYGAPTIRKRLFMVARCDGKPIVWPEQTHYKVPPLGKKKWRPIADCLDWSLKCPSIFLAGEAAKAARCKRPLAPSTLRRIAAGIDRYVLRAAEPFLVSLTHQGGDRIEPTSEPSKTITGAHRGEKALVASKFHGSHAGRADGDQRNRPVTEPLMVQDTEPRFSLTEAHLTPFLTQHAHGTSPRSHSAEDPLCTQCAGVKGGHFAVVSPVVVNTSNGKFDAAPSRARSVEDPLPPQTAAPKFGVVTGTLVGAGGRAAQSRPRGIGEPVHTVTAKGDTCLASAVLVGAGGPAYSGKPKPIDTPGNTLTTEHHTGLAAVNMVKLRGSNVGDEAAAPMHTASAGGQHHALITGTLVHTAHGERDSSGKKRGRGARDVRESMPAVLASPDGALASASLIRHFGESVGQDVDAPAPTTMANGGGKTGLLAAHLTKFTTGSVGQELDQPGPTIMAGSHQEHTHGGAATTQGVVAAYLAQHNGGFNETVGHEATEPLSTISAKGSQQQLVAASITRFNKTEKDGQSVQDPSKATTTKPRAALVESTAVSPMTEEQIAGAHQVAAFLRAHGVQFEGEFAMVRGYVIVDIGMRMLTPRELYRAQGFPDTYVIDQAWLIDPKTGRLTETRLTKEEQIRFVGNSVSPPPYAAIVQANVPELSAFFQGERPKSKVHPSPHLQPA